MLNPVCFLVSLSSLFLSFILSRFPFFVSVWRCGRRSLRPSGVGRLPLRVSVRLPWRVCRGWVCCRLSPSAVAVRTGPLSWRSPSVWLRAYMVGAVGWSAGRSVCVPLRRSPWRSGCPSVWRSLRCGSVVARRSGCPCRRESFARALRSASGGGSLVGVDRGRVGLVFASFRLVSTF